MRQEWWQKFFHDFAEKYLEARRLPVDWTDAEIEDLAGVLDVAADAWADENKAKPCACCGGPRTSCPCEMVEVRFEATKKWELACETHPAVSIGEAARGMRT